ncbi:MAG: nuclear transport factor 2 family protein [Hyphomonadaceae bacterium]|nr:nuclear transport factor 2 family protein [Hyphomonadaceae bacterium]GIK47607.1 MAG: polyketide cyclase [Alphaproteobacteria bacterium]
MNDIEFAKRYYAAWNARDIDGILALYAEDIEFSSPYIAALGFAHDGVIHGKAMLRAYFERALDRAPALTFSPEAILVGARGHTLVYRNHRGERVAETHEVDTAGLIVRADAAYETA